MFDTALAESAAWKTIQLDNLRIARKLYRCGAPTQAAEVAAQAIRLASERKYCKLTARQRKDMQILIANVAN